jgi:hypothetical protein
MVETPEGSTDGDESAAMQDTAAGRSRPGD